MPSCGKWRRSSPPPEVMFFRNVFGALVFVPWLVRHPAGLRMTRPGMHFLRALAHVCGMVLWVYGLTLIPFATATALAFSSPLFVVVAATVFMGERAGSHRWLAVGLGFAGVLIVVQPRLEASGLPDHGLQTLGVAVMLASAVFLALSKLLTKVVARHDDTLTVVFYLNVFMALAALGPTVWMWPPPTPTHLGWFVVLALLGAVAQWCLTEAVSRAELTALQPFEFVALVWAAAIGFFVFNETPAAHVVLGGAVIVRAATYVSRTGRRGTRVLNAVLTPREAAESLGPECPPVRRRGVYASSMRMLP